MNFLNEAFKSLKRLNEETFDLSLTSGQDDLKNFLDDDEEIDTVTIIDDEAETEDEIKDTYIGKVILDCNICHSLIYKNPDDVVIDEDGENANLDDECPYCFSTGDGFKIIGQVRPFTTTEEEDEDDDFEDEDDDFEVEDTDVDEEDIEEEDIDEEELTESCESCKTEGCSDDDELNELFDVNAQGQTIGVGLGGGTGITATPGGLKVPGIDESHPSPSDVSDNSDDFTEMQAKKMDESIQDMSLTTDDGTELSMSSGEDGEVTITTKPGCQECEDIEEKSEEEMIGPVDLSTQLDIENNSEEDDISVDDVEPEEEPEEDEIEIEDFDEESFDDLGESYLKKVYENVDSFRCSNIYEDDKKFYVEGLIKFNSGKEKKTTFVFEAVNASRNGSALLEGYNKEIARGNKSFKLNCSYSGNTLICESLQYRYNQNKKTVNGTVKRG